MGEILDVLELPLLMLGLVLEEVQVELGEVELIGRGERGGFVQRLVSFVFHDQFLVSYVTY